MRRIIRISSIIVIVLLLQNRCPAQFRYDRYQPARLDTINFLPVHLLNDTCRFVVLDTDTPLRADVYYTDSIRTIDSLSAVVIADWCTEVIHNPDAIGLFEQEVLVYEGNVPLWIPVQKQLVPALKKEVMKDQLVWIYVNVAGATKSRIVFTLNEFETLEH